MNFDFFSTNAIATAPIILAVVQAIRMATNRDITRWAPLISIGLGVIASFLMNNEVMTASEMAVNGVVAGLSASGLYSGVKTVVTAPSTQGSSTNGPLGK